VATSAIASIGLASFIIYKIISTTHKSIFNKNINSF
jgi:hypothetical protein